MCTKREFEDLTFEKLGEIMKDLFDHKTSRRLIETCKYVTEAALNTEVIENKRRDMEVINMLACVKASMIILGIDDYLEHNIERGKRNTFDPLHSRAGSLPFIPAN